MPILLKNLTSAELHAALAPRGVSLRLARRLQAAVLRRGEFPAELPEVSGQLLKQIRAAVELPRLEVLDRRVSPRDGFAKVLFRGAGLDVVWPQFAALAVIGVALFWLALMRFRKFLR